MKQAKTLLTVSALLFASVAITVSCGTTSRYKADEFGPKQEGKMDVALANIDKAMGDMAATKKRAMAKQAEVLRLGKALYNDTSLGTNGQSCNSCHPGGGTTGGEAHVAKKMGHGPYELPIPSLDRKSVV